MEEEKKTRQEGMTRRGKIILTVFAGAVIVFLIWWLIPRSFEGITGMKGIQPQKISCTIQPADIEASPLQITVTDSEETATIISHLKSSKYRPDVRHPLSSGGYSSDAYDGRSIRIGITDPEGEYWKYSIDFVDAKAMVITTVENPAASDFTYESEAYSPLEPELFNRLYDYIESLEPVEVTKAEPEDQGK